MSKIKDFIKKHLFWVILISLETIIAIVIIFTIKESKIYSTTLMVIFFTSLDFLFFGIKNIIVELWLENPIYLIAGAIALAAIITIMALTTDSPKDITNDILVYLATIGALLFAFIPKGLVSMNKSSILDSKVLPYEEKNLLKKIKDISYVLGVFIGFIILVILITPIFPQLIYIKKTTINLFKIASPIKASLLYDYFKSNSSKLEFFALVYIISFVFAVSGLIIGFLEIFIILKYFNDYDFYFNKLKSKYSRKGDLESQDFEKIDWIIKNKLYENALHDDFNLKQVNEDFKEKFIYWSSNNKCHKEKCRKRIILFILNKHYERFLDKDTGKIGKKLKKILD